MVRKVQRNEPCPCGSGKKYKKCCGLKARDLTSSRANRREGIQKSLVWVTRTHPEPVDKWVEEVWLSDISTDQRNGISNADARIRSVHDINLLELMVAEGTFADMEGESRPLQLILEADLDLDQEQLDYLKQLVEQPLRLYQVTECTPGNSYSLSEYPESNSDAVLIEDSTTSRMFDVGDIVGLRLMQFEDAWETSGAVYHIPEEYAEDLVKQLQDGKAEEYSKILSSYWLTLVAAHA